MADDDKKEKPKSRREVLYSKGKQGKEGSAKEEATEPKAEAKAEGDPAAAAAPAGPSMGEKHSTARSEMMKRHEGERKDAHGNHRDMLRKMVMRHEKEIQALQAANEAEMASAAVPLGTGNEPAAPGAGAEPVAPPTEA